MWVFFLYTVWPKDLHTVYRYISRISRHNISDQSTTMCCQLVEYRQADSGRIELCVLQRWSKWYTTEAPTLGYSVSISELLLAGNIRNWISKLLLHPKRISQLSHTSTFCYFHPIIHRFWIPTFRRSLIRSSERNVTAQWKLFCNKRLIKSDMKNSHTR